MLTYLIGEQSSKVKNVVERSAVKKFAQAINDENSIYIDEKIGENSRYGHNIAPPTFPRIFDFGEINELKLPEKGIIHGKQSYFYERPLKVGEKLVCYMEVKDYYEKEGKSGSMGFIEIYKHGETEKGEKIFIEKSVIIVTEKVKEMMMK